MATNKNQHFVPRCYLKPFTLDGENAAINLFNIDRSLFIEQAPVKNQCSRDYFYGEDAELERALQSIEGAYGNVLSRILQPGYQLNASHRQLLLRFWLLQHLRTEAASRRSNEMFEGMKTVASLPNDTFKTTIREVVQMAMRTFVEIMDVVDDLKVRIIRNRTTLPFITSDDPAIMTNRWHFRERRTLGRSPGLQSAGAIILLPLTPKLLCLGYDGDVYSVPHTNGWVDVKRDADVAAFNDHQFFNCVANIYFRDWPGRQRIRAGFENAVALRPATRHRTHYAVFDRSEHGMERYRVIDAAEARDHEKALIHSQVVYVSPAKWPTLLAWRSKGVAYTNGTGVGYIRAGALHRQSSSGFKKVRA